MAKLTTFSELTKLHIFNHQLPLFNKPGGNHYAFVNFAVGNNMEVKFPEFLEDRTKSSKLLVSDKCV